MAISKGSHATQPGEPFDAERIAVLEGQLQDLRDMLAKLLRSRKPWQAHAERMTLGRGLSRRTADH